MLEFPGTNKSGEQGEVMDELPVWAVIGIVSAVIAIVWAVMEVAEDDDCTVSM